jgi:hypothetical protein
MGCGACAVSSALANTRTWHVCCGRRSLQGNRCQPRNRGQVGGGVAMELPSPGCTTHREPWPDRLPAAILKATALIWDTDVHWHLGIAPPPPRLLLLKAGRRPAKSQTRNTALCQPIPHLREIQHMPNQAHAESCVMVLARTLLSEPSPEWHRTRTRERLSLVDCPIGILAAYMIGAF